MANLVPVYAHKCLKSDPISLTTKNASK